MDVEVLQQLLAQARHQSRPMNDQLGNENVNPVVVNHNNILVVNHKKKTLRDKIFPKFSKRKDNLSEGDRIRKKNKACIQQYSETFPAASIAGATGAEGLYEM